MLVRDLDHTVLCGIGCFHLLHGRSQLNLYTTAHRSTISHIRYLTLSIDLSHKRLNEPITSTTSITPLQYLQTSIVHPFSNPDALYIAS